jgi:shikimate dehydrogenase
MDRYVVIGNPVSHSLSPEIHASFARALGEDLRYDAMLALPGGFVGTAREFFDGGGLGANVTLPFKQDAFEFAHAASDRAKLAGAANVLARRGDRIEADNTDGAGLVADLRNCGVDPAGKRVLILGAGGAARGVIAPLLAAGVDRVLIANRTARTAIDLAHRFESIGPVRAADLRAIAQESFDLVLNATSTSIRGEVLELPAHVLRAGTFAYDMAYGPAARAFVERARAHGARASDGLGMLVEQAAESFMIWRGRRPPTADLLATLRARFA